MEDLDLPPPAAGTTYVPITPVRVLDTRPGPGQIGLSGKFTAKVARTWQVTGVGGRIPAGAVAVTGNVTVTQQEAVGFVAVTPTATNTPAVVDDQHPARRQPGQQPDRARCRRPARCRPPTSPRPARRPHLIFDVTGYFLADDTGATFSPLAPVRVLDTRPGPGQVGLAGTFADSVPRTLTIAGTNGVPADRDRDHRQPDRHPAVGRRLPGDHQGPDRGPGHLDPQLPGQRQPGQRRVRPARRRRGRCRSCTRPRPAPTPTSSST